MIGLSSLINENENDLVKFQNIAFVDQNPAQDDYYKYKN